MRVIDGWVQSAKDSTSSEASDPKDPKGGYDIRDYEKAAQAITRAGSEVRLLISDAKDLTPSPELNSAVGDAVTHAGDTLEGVVDHLFWRSIQLVVLIFASVALYRFVELRLRKEK